MGGVLTVRTLQESKRRCQLVVRLKVNKCYQKLLCPLSFYIKLLNILNLQGLRGWLQASGRFQTSSPWSISQTSDLCRYLYFFLYLVNCSLVRSVAIWPLSDESLALSQSDLSRLVVYSWSVGAFGIVLAIIFLSNSRRNHSVGTRMITHLYQTSTRNACTYCRII